MELNKDEIVAIDFKKDIIYQPYHVLQATYADAPIYFIEYGPYVGPITMQYLPNGGIQSLFHGLIIIKVNNGFMQVSKLIYQNKIYTSQEFIESHDSLMNQVLENGKLQ